MYVTDDEAAKLAFETVQELAELDEDQCYELANDSDDIVLEIKPIEEESENHLIAENLPKETTEVTDLEKEAALNDEKALKLFSIFNQPNKLSEVKNKKIADKTNKTKTITTQVLHQNQSFYNTSSTSTVLLNHMKIYMNI